MNISRIARIRAEIEAGCYPTLAKLGAIVDPLLADLALDSYTSPPSAAVTPGSSSDREVSAGAVVEDGRPTRGGRTVADTARRSRREVGAPLASSHLPPSSRVDSASPLPPADPLVRLGGQGRPPRDFHGEDIGRSETCVAYAIIAVCLAVVGAAVAAAMIAILGWVW